MTDTTASIQRLAGGLAQRIAEDARPLSPQLHLVPGRDSTQLLAPDGSRLFHISKSVEQQLRALMEAGDEEQLRQELGRIGVDAVPYIDDQPLESPPLHAISLAIAQKCNMGCSYCYADQGDFGGPQKNMPLENALAAIDQLLDGLQAGDRAQVTFLGGEPLVNRIALRSATNYAAEQAAQKGIQVGFSITTNGTLVQAADVDFFEQHGFAVTISLDGLKDQHDGLRPLRGGQGSYDRILRQIAPLLERQRKMQVSARVTVTPLNQDLPTVLDEFISMGFHSVGFSPLLRSSSGTHEMSRADLEVMLQGMVACGLQFEQAVMAGRRYPFLNMINALKEISNRTHRPYPCGAGAGYMGVSADGEYYACHRFVNEPAGHMGSISDGIDPQLQNTWLADRHVHFQSPCNQCWARYLCGGGCHHEVIERGRTACDYIRGWLHYTLQAHERLSRFAPDWNR